VVRPATVAPSQPRHMGPEEGLGERRKKRRGSLRRRTTLTSLGKRYRGRHGPPVALPPVMSTSRLVLMFEEATMVTTWSPEFRHA
jgi:hypothetical protein